VNGSTASRLPSGPSDPLFSRRAGRGKNDHPPGVEKACLFFGGKVTERSPERELLLGDRPASGLRHERSVREREGNRYLSGSGLERLFCSFQVDPQTWQL